MQRREFIAGLGSAAAWPIKARAQQRERMRRVGVLMGGPATGTEFQSYLAAFIQELRHLGRIEGQNLHIDIRWNAGDIGLAPTYAAQLIGQGRVLIVNVAGLSPGVERPAGGGVRKRTGLFWGPRGAIATRDFIIPRGSNVNLGVGCDMPCGD